VDQHPTNCQNEQVEEANVEPAKDDDFVSNSVVWSPRLSKGALDVVTSVSLENNDWMLARPIKEEDEKGIAVGVTGSTAVGPNEKQTNVDEEPETDPFLVHRGTIGICEDAALEDESFSDGTGSTPSTVIRRVDIAKQELKFRCACAERYIGNSRAFATSRECLMYLNEHGHSDDFAVYQALVVASNVARHPHRASHILDAIVDKDTVIEKMHRYGQSVAGAGTLCEEAWPLDTSITDLHRSRTSESKLLLERLCLRCKVQVQTKADLDRCVGRRLGISFQSVMWQQHDEAVIVAFKTLQDMRAFSEAWKEQLSDIICEVETYRASPTIPDTTVWFFGFLMDKLTTTRIKSAVEAYGEVLNVSVQRYHDFETKELPLSGFVEFKDQAGAHNLLKNRFSFFYRITGKTYQVVKLPKDAQSWYCSHLSFNADSRAEPPPADEIAEEHNTSAQEDSTVLKRQGFAPHQGVAEERRHGVGDVEKPIGAAPAADFLVAEEAASSSTLPDAAAVCAPQDSMGAAAIQELEDQGSLACTSMLKYVDPKSQDQHTSQTMVQGLQSTQAEMETREINVWEERATETLRLQGCDISAIQTRMQAPPGLPLPHSQPIASNFLDEQTEDPNNSRQHAKPLAIDFTPQPDGSIDPDASHASERKAATKERSLSFSQSPDADVTPQPTPSIIGVRDCEGEISMPKQFEAYSQLEELVAGMGKVVECARLLELNVPDRGGCAYAQKICEWIVENEAVDGAEILENIEDLVKFLSMKSLTIKRFRKALADEYGTQ